MAEAVRNFGITSVGIIALSLTAVLLYLETERKTKNVCKTVECINQAARILNAMNTTANPCVDFYQYACGGWIKNNPIPEGKGVIHQFNLVSDANNKILRDILSSDHSMDREAVKKAKIYYKACVNEEQLNLLDAQPAFDWIKTLGGFPLFGDRNEDKNFNLEKFLAHALVKTAPILSTYVSADAENSSKHLIFIEQPNLMMPDRQFYLSENFTSTQIVFRKFLHDFLEMLWKSRDKKNKDLTFDVDALDSAVNKIYELEKDLAEIIIPRQKLFDLAKVFKKTSLSDASGKIGPDFDWSAYTRAIFLKHGIELEDNTKIGTRMVPYLSNMMSVLKNYNNSAIQNYVVVYNLVKSFGSFPKKYRDTASGYRKAISGSSVEEARWKVCVRKATSSLPMAVGATYAESAFLEKSRTQILEMTDIITKSFTDKLSTMNWMDEETRNAAKKKVDALVSMMAYPDYITNRTNSKLDDEYERAELREKEFYKNECSLAENDLFRNIQKLNKTVDKSEWFISPAVVNAYYHPLQNTMVFPAGIMQSPFFSVGNPVAANFGGIGLVIAHELTHGFDKTGSSVDETGKLKNWWTNSSRANFNAAEKCFVEQFNNYLHETAGKNVSGKLTVKENVADSGGLGQAFEAYQIWKEQNPNKELSLPGLEKYTPEQLLFISYAQVFCQAQTREEAITRLLDDSHSPGPIRVKGAVHNIGEFGKTFQCKQGVDEMYRMPEDRCSLW